VKQSPEDYLHGCVSCTVRIVNLRQSEGVKFIRMVQEYAPGVRNEHLCEHIMAFQDIKFLDL
jgi:hypothetical protein